jgi:hypothetical protein
MLERAILTEGASKHSITNNCACFVIPACRESPVCHSRLSGIAGLSFRLVRNPSFKKDAGNPRQAGTGLAGMTDFWRILYYA